MRRYLGDVEGVVLEDGKFKIKGGKGDANQSKDIMPDAVFYLENGRVVVAVEMKHVNGRLSGEPLQQLLRYAELVSNPGKFGFEGQVIEVRYVFSSKEAAVLNHDRIRALLNDKARIYYLDVDGNSLMLL